METYVGTSPQARGSSGPLDVKQAPTNPLASGNGNNFVNAAKQYFDATFGWVDGFSWLVCWLVGWFGGLLVGGLEFDEAPTLSRTHPHTKTLNNPIISA